MSFDEAVENVKKLKTEPTDDEKLQLYGLYKQATVGNVNTDRPGFFNYVARAKWDAWNSQKDVGNDEVKNRYVILVNGLIDLYGIQD